MMLAHLDVDGAPIAAVDGIDEIARFALHPATAFQVLGAR